MEFIFILCHRDSGACLCDLVFGHLEGSLAVEMGPNKNFELICSSIKDFNC